MAGGNLQDPLAVLLETLAGRLRMQRSPRAKTELEVETGGGDQPRKRRH